MDDGLRIIPVESTDTDVKHVSITLNCGAEVTHAQQKCRELAKPTIAFDGDSIHGDTLETPTAPQLACS